MKLHHLFTLTISVAALAACNRDLSSPTVASRTDVSLHPADTLTGTTTTTTATTGSTTSSAAPGAFLETFDGSPATPTAYLPPNWDVARHASYFFPFAPMDGMHGMDCSAPPATHPIPTIDGAVFQCRDHMMTSLYTHGYAEIAMTPNQLVDFSNGESVVSFDVSTLRTAGRDWIDLWITPFSDVIENPVDNGTPDLSDAPNRAVQIELPPVFGLQGLDPRYSYFVGRVYDGFQPTPIAQATYKPYPSVLTPSATVRTRYELHISRTHVKFGIPAYNLWWIDADIPALAWTQGTLTLAHHSYHPVAESLCNICTPDTWHWDNVGISSAVPFTIIQGDRRQVQRTDANNVVNFSRPAPANSFLRFAALAGSLDVSFDNGATWQPAQVKQPQQLKSRAYYWSYWTPIPQGTQSVRFRGTWYYGNGWVARDFAIWSLTAP